MLAAGTAWKLLDFFFFFFFGGGGGGGGRGGHLLNIKGGFASK